MALDAITIPLMLIGGIVFMIYLLVAACTTESRNKRKAEQRIKEMVENNKKLVEDPDGIRI